MASSSQHPTTRVGMSTTIPTGAGAGTEPEKTRDEVKNELF